MKLKFFFLAIFSTALFASCDKDDPEPHSIDIPEGRLLLIGNQGGFTNENAEVTLINLDQNTTTPNAFAHANDGALLGDILQSMTQIGDEIYLVVNNSAKVEVVNADDLTRTNTIAISNSSPRYMLDLGGDKAYVSDLYSNVLHLIHPSTGTYGGQIDVGIAVESMAMYNGEVYATGIMGDTLVVIDPATDEVIRGVGVPGRPDDLAFDALGRLWCMTEGEWEEGGLEPMVYIFDPQDLTLLSTLEFPEGTGIGSNMAMNSAGDIVYLMAGGEVYAVNIHDIQWPENPWKTQGSLNYYSMFVDPQTDDVVIATSVDATQNGKVFIYSPDGAEKRSYTVGVFPGSALWVER